MGLRRREMQSLWPSLSSQKIALQLKATLENVTNLRPVGEDFRWYLKVRLQGRGSDGAGEEPREAVGTSSFREGAPEAGPGKRFPYLICA